MPVLKKIRLRIRLLLLRLLSLPKEEVYSLYKRERGPTSTLDK